MFLVFPAPSVKEERLPFGALLLDPLDLLPLFVELQESSEDQICAEQDQDNAQNEKWDEVMQIVREVVVAGSRNEYGRHGQGEGEDCDAGPYGSKGGTLFGKQQLDPSNIDRLIFHIQLHKIPHFHVHRNCLDTGSENYIPTLRL